MRNISCLPAGRVSAALCVTALLVSQASAGDVSKSTKTKAAKKPVPVSKSLSSKAAHGKLDRFDQPGKPNSTTWTGALRMDVQ